MTAPTEKPRRRNPLARIPAPTMPPVARSRTAHLLTKAAAEGRFALQRCAACGAFAYPPRDACPACLSADLPLAEAPRGGTLLTETTVRVPAEVYFRERAPWRIGLVGLDCGPKMVAHLHAECREGERVRLSLQIDAAGAAVAFAHPALETPNMADDRQWRALTADPRSRRVLVTDGRGAVGQAVAAALAEAGAATVYVGVGEAWKPFPGEAALRALPAVEIVNLDPGDERSAFDLAADIGGRVDILVHTAEHVRPGGLLGRRGAGALRDELDKVCFGLVHLAQAFGPAMKTRGADGAAAWVNVLSVHALANWPAYGAHSAAQAAALSLAQCLRAELRPGGIKVVNLFTGPTDTEWFQTVPPPKVAPRAVGAAVVGALKAGNEDAFVGDVAEDLRRRLVANPKAVEREFGA